MLEALVATVIPARRDAAGRAEKIRGLAQRVQSRSPALRFRLLNTGTVRPRLIPQNGGRSKKPVDADLKES